MSRVGRKLLVVVAILMVLLAQVSSDFNMEKEVEVEEKLQGRVTGGSRRLMQDVGLDCGGLCKERCKLHSRPNVCGRACGTCCVRCKCVPPGTSGNRELCGKCYTDMTTHANKTKCP